MEHFAPFTPEMRLEWWVQMGPLGSVGPGSVGGWMAAGVLVVEVFKVSKVFIQDVAHGVPRKQAVTPRCQGVAAFSGVFVFDG